MTNLRAQCANAMEEFRASLTERLIARVAKQFLCGPIPKADLARLPDNEDAIRRTFKEGEQFGFEHLCTPRMEALLL